jgi:LysR family transcriptional regulator, glycine cleavage system transcriptional activator
MNSHRRPRISLDLLRGFRVAARHLSFTRAAEELCVTQSAISHEIRALEAQIGQPLFHREHRALQLTRVGEELYRVADQALAQIDTLIDALDGNTEILSVTTTSGLASLWLAPRLPRFNKAHPGIDVQVVASNDRPDLERDKLDIAIRFVPPGDDAPDADRLMECTCFPVCSPELARSAPHPIRTPADLAHHVRLDYETVRDGRRLSEWRFWFDAQQLRPVKPASTLQFPQYDQVVAAAIEGSGVALGVMPHLTQYLREGVLCAPFGPASIAQRGTFFVARRSAAAQRPAVEAFVNWLWSEVRREGGAASATRRKVDRQPDRRANTKRSRPRTSKRGSRTR